MSLSQTFRPLFDRVLLQKIATEAVTRGGVIIPTESAQNKSIVQAKVLAVGPGRVAPSTGQFMPLKTVKAGDVVMIPDFAGLKFADEKEDLRIVREEEILGCLDVNKE